MCTLGCSTFIMRGLYVIVARMPFNMEKTLLVNNKQCTLQRNYIIWTIFVKNKQTNKHNVTTLQFKWRHRREILWSRFQKFPSIDFLMGVKKLSTSKEYTKLWNLKVVANLHF